MSEFNKVFGPDGASWYSHVIQARDGLSMVQAAAQMEAPSPAEDYHSVAFAAEAIYELLRQEGAMGIKAMKAHNGHHHTEVWFAVDKFGQPLTGNGFIALENGERCPPFC